MFFAEKKRNAAEDAKAAIDETPRKWNAADGAGNERERDDSGARDEAEVEEPAVADGIAIWSDEGDGDNEMCEGEPVCAVGEEGILAIRDGLRGVDTIDPGEQVDRFCEGLEGVRLQEAEKPVKFGFEGEGRYTTEDEANDERGEPDADGA